MTQKQIEQLEKLGFSETTCEGQYVHSSGMVYVYDREYPECKSLNNPIQISFSIYPKKSTETEDKIRQKLFNVIDLIFKVRQIIKGK